MQEMRVQSLVPEDPTYCGATKPVRGNYRGCALEPGAATIEAVLLSSEPQILSPREETTEACTLQQEMPPRREGHPPQLESSPCSLQPGKSCAAMEGRPSQQ